MPALAAHATNDPSLPFSPTWTGGRLEGVDDPSLPDWFDEARHDPQGARWRRMNLLPEEADPPGPTGWEVSTDWTPQPPAPRLLLRGTVKLVSRTGGGLILVEDPDRWLNLSRFSKPAVDFTHLYQG